MRFPRSVGTLEFNQIVASPSKSDKACGQQTSVLPGPVASSKIVDFHSSGTAKWHGERPLRKAYKNDEPR